MKYLWFPDSIIVLPGLILSSKSFFFTLFQILLGSIKLFTATLSSKTPHLPSLSPRTPWYFSNICTAYWWSSSPIALLNFNLIFQCLMLPPKYPLPLHPDFSYTLIPPCVLHNHPGLNSLTYHRFVPIVVTFRSTETMLYWPFCPGTFCK